VRYRAAASLRKEWWLAYRGTYGLIGEMQTPPLVGLFERLIGLTNDLGLPAEEYDVRRQRQVGNFPQAFSHLTLIGAATAIAAADAKEAAA